MANQGNYKSILRDLFPFKNEYSLFFMGLIVLLCTTFIQTDDYTGITLKATNEFVTSSHRLLWDVLFFLTLFTALYIFLIYLLKGFSRSTIAQLRKHRKLIQKKKNSKKSPLLEATVLIALYILSFNGFFMVDPTKSSKSLWLYNGNIYFDLVFMFFLYSSFTIFTVLITVVISALRDH